MAVTVGAGTSIGFAATERCTKEGAIAAIGDKHECRLFEVVDQLEADTGAQPAAIV